MFGLPKLGIWMAGFSNITSMIVSICIYLFFAREDIKRINVSVNNYYLNIVTHFKESCIFFLQDIIDSSVFVVFINMIIIRIGEVDFAAYSAIGYVVGILIVIKYVYGSAIISIVSVAKGNENKYSINGWCDIVKW